MRWKIPTVVVALLVSGLLVFAGLATLAGGQEEQSPEEMMQEWNTAIAVPLTGEQEREGPVETNATGIAVFWLDEDMESMCYLLFVANVTDVNQAHIHMAENENESGPPVVWLYPEEGRQPQVMPGETSGILAMGTFTAADFVGPMENMTMNDLLMQMDEGNLYVNVHNEEHPAGVISGDMNVREQTCDSVMGMLENATQESPEAAPAPAMPTY